MNPNSTLETARAWLENPKNARDRDYHRLSGALVSAEMAIQWVADCLGKIGVATMNSSTPRAAGITPSAGTEEQLAAEILALAAPMFAARNPGASASATAATDPEAALAASILASAGFTPRER